MNTYHILVAEVFSTIYEIEADSEAEALKTYDDADTLDSIQMKQVDGEVVEIAQVNK